MCTCMCTTCMQHSWRSEVGVGSLELQLETSGAAMCVLGTEPRVFGEAAGALNCWAISPALRLYYFTWCSWHSLCAVLLGSFSATTMVKMSWKNPSLWYHIQPHIPPFTLALLPITLCFLSRETRAGPCEVVTRGGEAECSQQALAFPSCP